MRYEIGSRLPNTLMLECFMRGNAKHGDRTDVRNRVRRGIDRLERFACKFRDGQDYSLLRADQFDEKAVRRVMASWHGLDHPVEFVSRTELLETTALISPEYDASRRFDPEREEERAKAGAAHDGLLALYAMAAQRSLRRWLPKSKTAQFIKATSGDGRDLENIVSVSLGTQLLLDALDRGFGNSFAHVFKDDIVEYWTCYFGHLLDGDTQTVERIEPLSELMRATFPVLKTEAGLPHPRTGLVETAPRWIMMTD